MKIKLFKTRSVFSSWLISYFSLLLIPIIISSVVYFEAYRIVKAGIIHENSAVLKQVKLVIDNGMKTVENFSNFVVFDQSLNQLIQEKDRTVLNSQYYQVNSLMNELRNYKFPDEYVEDFYVYFKKLDYVLTTNNFDDSDYFFKHYPKGIIYRNIMPYSEWKTMVGKEYEGEYLPFEIKDANTGYGMKSVIFIKSMPIFGVGQSNATFVITLNNKRFNDEIAGIGTTNSALGIIIDKRNNVLYSTKPLAKPFPVKYEALTKDSDLIYGKLDNQDVAISYITSGVEDWKYISVVPLQVFQDKVGYIRNLIGASLIFSILLGGIFAYIFSRRNYGPVHELMEFIEKKERQPLRKELNEYRYIKDAMNNTLNENNRINQRLRQQNNVLKSNFLMKLLKGRLEDRSFISRSLQTYDLDFDSGSFAVILFYIMDFDKLFINYKEKTADEQLEFVNFIITNVVEELVSKNNSGCMTEVDKMPACIVNLKSSDNVKNKQDMLAIAREAAEYLLDVCKINLLVSVSDIHETYFGISEAYQEALSVMEYKKALETNEIISYDQIRTSNSNYNYTLETEHQLINCIKAGELDAAKSIINNIFEKNFSKTIFSASMLKCLLYDLVSTMLKTMSDINIPGGSFFIQELNITQRLLNCEKVQDMKQQMTAIMEDICAYIQHNRKSKKENLLTCVVEFIEASYHDANLSVSSIADKFQLTPTYLTKLFKEQTGEGLFEHITRIRMEKAKSFLKNQEYSIKDVADMVGYYSSTAFIRTFKKYEGVTPGSYKEI